MRLRFSTGCGIPRQTKCQRKTIIKMQDLILGKTVAVLRARAGYALRKER